MPIQNIKWPLAIIALLIVMMSQAQDSSFSVGEAIRKLSVKEDIKQENYWAIYSQLHAMDEKSLCETLAQLKAEMPKRNIEGQIRLVHLESFFYLIFRRCPDQPVPIKMMESALRTAYEQNELMLAADLHRTLGELYYQAGGSFVNPIMHKYKAMELRQQLGEHLFVHSRNDLYELGGYFYQIRDYKSAADLYEEVIYYNDRRSSESSSYLEPYWMMNAWNNLGLCYKRLMKYDSAFLAFDKAYTLAVDSVHEPFWISLIEGNIGDMYFLQGKYDTAEVLLKKDFEQSLVAEEYSNAAITLQRLALIENEQGHHQLALRMLRDAYKLERKESNADTRNILYAGFAEVFKDLGQADSSYYYLNLNTEQKAALERQTADYLFDLAKSRLDNQENIDQVRELSRAKNNITLVRNILIIVVILIGINGYLYINRIRMKAAFRQQQMLEEKKAAETESIHTKEKLDLFTRSLVEKSNLVDQLQAQLLSRDVHEEQVSQITTLTNQAILTETDWEKFKSLFDKVYPGFFFELRNKVTDITQAEQRMAALCKLQLTSREAGNILGISVNSVNKTKQRLRQRLGLNPDENLEAYFIQFGS